MRLKRTLVSTIAALGLSASLMAPVALAQPSEDDPNAGANWTYSTVNVKDDGVFDVYFYTTNLAFGDITLNASNPIRTINGSFTIGYVDTKSWRPAFDVTAGATDFVGTVNSNTNTISADEFLITRTYNVAQGQWGGPGSTTSGATTAYDPGDIGYMVNGVDPNGQGAYGDWTADNELSQSPPVHYAYEGVGTIWSTGQVDISLEIPENTRVDNYQTTVTLSVIVGSHQP